MIAGFIYSDNIQTTNINYEITEKKLIPNIYLKTKAFTNEVEEESLLRRFDLIYFISLPITYYLVLNIQLIKNNYYKKNITMYNSDYNYLYINVFTIPLANAYNDLRNNNKKGNIFYIEKEKQFDWDILNNINRR